MAREYTTYKIKITTTGNESLCDDENISFYYFRTNCRKQNLKSNFLKEIKSAVKEWFNDDPDTAEAVATDYGCLNDRTDYRTAKAFVLDSISTRAFEEIPAMYLKRHGISDVPPADLELEFDECDNMIGK